MKRLFYSVSLCAFALGLGLCFPGFRVWASGITQQAYNTIENAGSALTQRSVLNFASGCTASDDSMNLRTNVTCSGGGGGGGVNVQTGNYTLQGSDSGKLVVMNCSSACTVTFYGSPTSTYTASITSVGSTTATVSTNSINYNGTTTPPVLIRYQVLNTWSDGTVYYGQVPSVAGTNMSFTPAPNGLTYTASGGGGGSVTAASPYIEIGTTFYSPISLYAVTKPPTPTYINSRTPNQVNGAGTNGDWVAATNIAQVSFQTQSCTTSVEAEFYAGAQNNAAGTDAGIWVYDSTNSHIWEYYANGGNASARMSVNEWNYSGSGDPSFNNNTVNAGNPPPAGIYHLKLVKASTTLTFEYSLNGGVTFIPFLTETVGTIAQCGWDVGSGTSDIASIDVLSLVTN